MTPLESHTRALSSPLPGPATSASSAHAPPSSGPHRASSPDPGPDPIAAAHAAAYASLSSLSPFSAAASLHDATAVTASTHASSTAAAGNHHC